MAAQRLLHWAVEYYSAAAEPHVCVTLEGDTHRRGMPRRPRPVVERITLPIERGVPADYQANQHIVRRAMRQSHHRWRGTIP